MWGGGGSDRLDHESTHRRTLFNVSLTFLVSISSPLTCSCWREEQRDGEREPGEEEALPLYSNQGHEPQTKSRVRVHARAGQSGRARIRFHSAMRLFSSVFPHGRLLCFLFRHPQVSIHPCRLSSCDLWPCYEVINATGKKGEEEEVSRSICGAV